MDKDTKMFSLSVLANITTLVFWETIGWWLVWLPVAAYGILWYLIYRKHVQPRKQKPTFVEKIPSSNFKIKDLLVYSADGNLRGLLDGFEKDERWKKHQKAIIAKLQHQIVGLEGSHKCLYLHVPHLLYAIRPIIKEIKGIVHGLTSCKEGYNDSCQVAYDTYKAIHEELSKDPSLWTKQLARELEMP